MRASQWAWGVGFMAGGILLAAGVFPGAQDAAMGPRIGLGMVLATLGALIVGVPLVTWFLRMTTKPSDYEGNCPVGWACGPCGAFNLIPRKICRSCAAPMPVDKQAS